MKKTFVFVLLCALWTPLFAESEYIEFEKVYTSEGYYRAYIKYKGLYQGLSWADVIALNDDFTRSQGWRNTPNVKLSKGQWEVVNYMLKRYESKKGDTFLITIIPWASGGNKWTIYFVCEYTSKTEYTYWTVYHTY
jgi:ATP-dependent phosphoenolpyruvate carboxykinase